MLICRAEQPSTNRRLLGWHG